MAKFRKKTMKNRKTKKRRLNEEYAYRTVISSAILGGVFFIISLFFNIGIVSIAFNQNTYLLIGDFFIKFLSIILFFLFMTISIGNYKELTGKPVTWKELVLLVIFSLIQAITDGLVFAFSLMGIFILVIYLFFLQE
ncbi:MAG: hypothetical protein GF317_01920 [Candidatus Lokiarchaeota archaeon]|nr:hypothetical protein [Candidatus Lokiarchaeota archaeon]MBD3198698.1 hypothetical protein [Candidatus Lokiarchaeota archaeon]